MSEISVPGLRLFAMRALWGIVTPNLKEVSIQEKDHEISLSKKRFTLAIEIE